MLALLVLSGLVALWMRNARIRLTSCCRSARAPACSISALVLVAINAWSEISAMVISFAVACFFQWGAGPMGVRPRCVTPAVHRDGLQRLETGDRHSAYDRGLARGDLLTPPEKQEVLARFCSKIRAGGRLAQGRSGLGPAQDGAGWECRRPALHDGRVSGGLDALFGIGNLLYGASLLGGVLCAVSVASTICLMRLAGKIRLS
jgi:hypothetical protein